MSKTTAKEKSEHSKQSKAEALAQDAHKRIKTIGKRTGLSVTEDISAKEESEPLRTATEEVSNVTSNPMYHPEKTMELIAKSALDAHILQSSQDLGELRRWVVEKLGDFRFSFLVWVVPILIALIIAFYAYLDHKFDRVYDKISEEIRELKKDYTKPPQIFKAPDKK